jgi:hypothetical protein
MAAVTAPTPQLAEGQHVTIRHVLLGLLPGRIEQSKGASVTVALNVKNGKLASERSGSLVISLHGDVERIQRREFVRIPAILDVSVNGVDEPLGGETTTRDVSGSGIQIADPWNLPLGLDVRVELHLPGGDPVRSLGRVVRAGAEADQKGIRLDGLARADEDRLMRYIREREVQALRAARGR